MRKFKQELKDATRVDLVGKYFDRFFSTEMIPENVPRLAYLRELMSSEINRILANPQASKGS